MMLEWTCTTCAAECKFQCDEDGKPLVGAPRYCPACGEGTGQSDPTTRRHIVQFHSDSNGLVALCDDGSLWRYYPKTVTMMTAPHVCCATRTNPHARIISSDFEGCAPQSRARPLAEHEPPGEILWSDETPAAWVRLEEIPQITAPEATRLAHTPE